MDGARQRSNRGDIAIWQQVIRLISPLRQVSAGRDRLTAASPVGVSCATTMLEVQRRLRELLGLPKDFDAFGGLALQWLARRSQRLSLVWEQHGEHHFLVHPHHRAEIASEGLRYFWPRGGSRILAHGSADSLKAHLAQVLQSGGPYGGPKSEPPREGRRPAVITSWEGPTLTDRSWTYCYGEGYEARVRPIEGQHCLVLVSQTGSFRLENFGLHMNLAGSAHFYQRADDASEPDFRDTSRPWHVRVRGMPQRLLYTALPGLAGFAQTEVGEVYLCLLGINDFALVLVTPDAEPRCLVRGGVTEVNGWELLPGEALAILEGPPARFDPNSIAASLDELVQLAPPVREHLIALSRAASRVPGTREVRRLLWALSLAHEKGRRENFHDSDEAIFEHLVEHRFLDKAPQERARRGALQWLVDHTPLVRQSFSQRRRLWTIHLEWFSKPTRECIEAMAACHPQLLKLAEPD